MSKQHIDLKEVESNFTAFWQGINLNGLPATAAAIADSTRGAANSMPLEHLLAWGLAVKLYQPLPAGAGPVTQEARKQMYAAWDKALVELKQWGF